MSLEPGKPTVHKTTFTPYEIDANQKAGGNAAAPLVSTPSIRNVGISQSNSVPEQPAAAPAPASSAGPVGGYVPKEGKLTIEDVENELEMLMKRMEFLGETLQKLRAENAKEM